MHADSHTTQLDVLSSCNVNVRITVQSPQHYANDTLHEHSSVPVPDASHQIAGKRQFWTQSIANAAKSQGADSSVGKASTKMSGAVLTRVRIPGAARDFLPESASSADSLMLVTQPLCAVVCINI